MYYVWCAAALVIGLGLGMSFGMLLRAVIGHWESVATSMKVFRGVFLLIFGGGALGATPLFATLTSAGPENAAFYLLGLGGGVTTGVIGIFYPSPPYTVGRIRNVIQMSDALRDAVPDIEQRALLITTGFLPPRSIEREAKISEPELAQQLEQAADKLTKPNEASR